MTNLRTLLTETADRVADYREAVSDHRVGPEIDVERFRATFGGPFSAEGSTRRRRSRSWWPRSNPR